MELAGYVILEAILFKFVLMIRSDLSLSRCSASSRLVPTYAILPMGFEVEVHVMLSARTQPWVSWEHSDLLGPLAVTGH